MSRSNGIVAIILAAGQGKRMRSDLAKVLHKLCGKSMIRYVVEAARSVSPSRIILVVGHQAESVKEEMGGEGDVEFVLQAERLGTGHAVMQAQPLLRDHGGNVMVLTGDTPLLRGETLQGLISHHLDREASATVLTAIVNDPGGYGRIIRNISGDLLEIVEDRDATPEQKEVREINSGIFCFRCADMFSALENVERENAQEEFYLTDVMGILRDQGKKTSVFPCVSPEEVLGINDLAQLEEAERLMRKNG